MLLISLHFIVITFQMKELPSKISSKFLLFLDVNFHNTYNIFNEVHQSIAKIIETSSKNGVDTLMATAFKW